MAIASSDIQMRLSGGAANASMLASIGGAMSSTAWASNIFDDITAGESAAGESEYRCVYVRNNHGTLTWTAPVVFILTNTPSPGTDVSIGLGTSAKNGTETAVADENTAPAGVTFSAAANQAAGIALGDLGPGESRAIWIKRTVAAGAAAYADSFALRAIGSTGP